MSENERVHFKIALPVELKKQLEHHAVDSRRSLSAEIIHRLVMTLETGEPSIVPSSEVVETAKHLVRLLEEGDAARREKSKADRAARDQEALRRARGDK